MTESSAMNSEKLLATHPSQTHAADLQAICQPLKALNIHYFSHVYINNKQQFSALGMEPEFGALYHRKAYYRFDLHMAPLAQKESYIIWDTVKREKQTEALFNDFMDFNLGHTFSICLKQENHSDYFHFASKLGEEYMNQQYLLNLDQLYQFIYHFREKVNAHRDLKRAYDVKLSLPKENGGYFAHRPISIATAENSEFQLPNKRIYLNHETYLTTKEFECLKHLSGGKKIHEVAQIMGITPRTAKAHIENIKLKLNCETQFQLGAIFSSIKL